MKTQLVKDVMKIYSEFDETIGALPKQFGIHCPPGCGSCCSSPKVEATILEMAPLAEFLLTSPNCSDFLLQVEAEPVLDHCMFFTPDELHYNHGRCSVYPHRPTLCRLFGFAAVRDKYEKPVFAACKFIKEMIPHSVEAVQQYVDDGGKMLQFTEAAGRIAAIEPAWNQRYPINEALRHALKKVGLLLQFEVQETNIAATPCTLSSLLPTLENCS